MGSNIARYQIRLSVNEDLSENKLNMKLYAIATWCSCRGKKKNSLNLYPID